MKHKAFMATILSALTLGLYTLFVTQPVHAKDYTIRMLNFGSTGGMVFEPGYLKVSVGDTITFIPENSSHYVKSKIVPEGAAEWLSKLDEEYSVTIEQEGIYVYYCPPHLMMSMVGVIQAGNAVNQQAVMADIPGFARRMLQNKGRLESYLDQIEE